MMLETLKGIIAEYVTVDLDSITPETKLAQDLGFDSLDLVDIACAVEDEFEIEIPDKEVHNIITVGDVMKFIEKNQEK